MSNTNNKYFISYDTDDHTEKKPFKLWEFDLNEPSLLKSKDIAPENVIPNGNHLVQVGNYILQWSPLDADGKYNYRLLEFNPSETSVLGSCKDKEWSGSAVQAGSWPKGKFFGSRADFANAEGAEKGYEDGKDLMLISMHNFVLNWIPTAGRGTYQLFNFDHGSADPLPDPYTPQGAWLTIQEGHDLMHINGHVIDWVPADGSFSLWQFDAANDDPLSYPAAQKGNWSKSLGIDKNHTLTVIGENVLDWNIEDNTYRLWGFDLNSKNVLTGPIKKGHLPRSLSKTTELIPIETLLTQNAEPKAPGSMDFMRDKIEHVVYYMIENRSLDHVAGWLYDKTDKINVIGPDGPYRGVDHQPDFTNSYTNKIAGTTNGTSSFSYCLMGDLTPYFKSKDKITVTDTLKGINDGVQTLADVVYDKAKDWTCLSWIGIKTTDPKGPFGNITKDHKITQFNDGVLSDKIVLDLDQQDPYHDNSDTLRQMFYNDINDYYEKKTPDMGGFAWNNGTLEVMEGYSKEQLPVLNGLAEHFAISDDWFCSMPGGTDVNRAFSLTGNSLGHLNNFQNGATYTEWSDFAHRPSIWKTLWSNGIEDFRIYNSIEWINCKFTYNLFLKGQIPSIDGPFDVETHAPSINQFYSDLENGTLPKFAYLEPIWCATSGSTSYHPGNDLIPGERDLKKIYDAIQNSEYRDNTLLVVTFDEHGGLPDHVPPPYAAKPYANDSIGGFDFDIMGVRIPTILASTHIDKNTVFRSATEHAYCSTSILATILHWFGVPKSKWGLGERTSNAPTFEAVLSRETVRTDDVVLEAPHDANFPKKSEGKTDTSHLEVNALLESMTPRMITDMTPNMSTAERNKLIKGILANSKNVGELHKRLNDLHAEGGKN
jgi:hypothetical protein